MGEEGLFAEIKHSGDINDNFFVPFFGDPALGIRFQVFVEFLIQQDLKAHFLLM